MQPRWPWLRGMHRRPPWLREEECAKTTFPLHGRTPNVAFVV
nr:hypothetical protein [Kibdelosporangium sp. MJ126-NF4]